MPDGLHALTLHEFFESLSDQPTHQLPMKRTILEPFDLAQMAVSGFLYTLPIRLSDMRQRAGNLFDRRFRRTVEPSAM